MKTSIATLAFVLALSVEAIAQNPSLDSTFTPGTGPNSTVYSLTEQPNGYIIVAGSFLSYNGSTQHEIARLDPFGNLDSTFSVGMGPNYLVSAVAVQTNGQILIGGPFYSVNGTFETYIARLRNDGSLDMSFSHMLNNSVNDIKMQSNGTALVIGSFSSFDSVTRNGLALLNSDGSFNTSFNPALQLTNGAVSDAVIQNDGEVLLSIMNQSGQFTVERADTSGNVDTNFNAGFANGYIYSLALQGDGRIVLGGYFNNINGYSRVNLARLNSNGSMDTSFVPPITMDQFVKSVGIQPNGKIVIAGSFTTIGGVVQRGVARINTNGSLDTSFNSVISGIQATPCDFIQADGKILIGGAFSGVNGTNMTNLARLNYDGTLPNAPSYSQLSNIQFYAGMLLVGTTTNLYSVQYATNLNSTWITLTNLMLPTSPYLFIDTSSPAARSRFYRMSTPQ